MGSFSCLGPGFRGFKAKLFAAEGTPSKPTCCSWLQRSAWAGPCRETYCSVPLSNVNGAGRALYSRRLLGWDNVLQCRRSIVGLPDLLNNGRESAVFSHNSLSIIWTFRHDISIWRILLGLLLVTPVNYGSLNVFPQATIWISRVCFTYVFIIFNDIKPAFPNGIESSSG